jgi:ankyrin repeat protein
MSRAAGRAYFGPEFPSCLACVWLLAVLSLHPRCAIAERLWSTGFETKTLLDGIEFTIPHPAGLSISSSTVRSGSYSLRQNSLAAAYIEHQWLEEDADAHVFIRFYIRTAALPSTAARLLDVVDTSGNTHASLRLTGTGTLQLLNAATQVGPDSWALVPNLWHRVEMEYQSLNDAGYDVLQTRLDGTPFAASLKETLGTVAKVRLGNTVTLTGSTPDLYFDDVAVNDQNGGRQNEFPGPGGIMPQSPDVKSEIRATCQGTLVEYAQPTMVSAIAEDHSGQGRGIQTEDRVVITFDAPTNGCAITSGDVDAVLRLSNAHSWLDSGGRFGGAVWSTTKYPNDTLTITLSNVSGIPPTITEGDYISIGANTIKAGASEEELAGPVRITGVFTGPWYYHVRFTAVPGNVGRALQDYRSPFPDPNVCWHSISDALSAIKADGHEGPWVVQVDDAATYDDSVTVSNFPTNASATLTIRKNPSLSGRPTVYPAAAHERAFNIGRDDQKDGNNSYVTIQGFTISNNATGSDTATEDCLFIINENNQAMGQIVVEDCVFDGLGQTYDVRNTVAIYFFHVDTIFRNNEVKNFRDTVRGTGWLKGLLVTEPQATPIVGGQKLQVVGNSFHDNTGQLIEFKGNLANNWTYSSLFEGNKVYNNRGILSLTIVDFENLNLSNTIRNNVFYDNSLQNIEDVRGVLDLNYSHNSIIYHNTFYSNKLRQNIYVDGSSASGVEIVNNLICPSPGPNYAINVGRGAEANLIAKNNAFYVDCSGRGYPPGFGFSMAENTQTVVLYGGAAKTTATFNGANATISGNGYTLGGPGLDKNMHLVTGSVCIDRGIPGLVSDDINGKRRPLDAGYDIGADEYGAGEMARSLSSGHEPQPEGQAVGREASMHFAAYIGDIAKMERCVQQGVDVNKVDERGYAPLHYAARNGQKQAVEFLVAKGADVNVRSSEGRTPLFDAVDVGNRDVAALLVSRGADVNIRDRNGQMSLDAALSRNDTAMAKLLTAKGAEGSIYTFARLGDLDRVRACLEKGADVNARDPNGQTALHVAVNNEHRDVAELLISKGADVNAKDGRGDTPLICAVEKGDRNTVTLLVTKGADVNYTPRDDYLPLLHSMVWAGDVNTVKLLVDHGAKFDVQDRSSGWTAFRFAAWQGNRELVEFFASKGGDVSTLPLAACVGNLAQVKSLVESGADPNAKDDFGWTPLYWAVSTGQEEVAEYLIRRGAQVDAKMVNERTLLHQAAQAGVVHLVEVLISKGLDVKGTTTEGYTPLHLAAEAGRREVAEILIAKGADINAKTTDEAKTTPLHMAAFAGHKDVVELLIAKGADASIREYRGHTALGLAEQRGHTETADILRKHGAKE